MKFIKNLLIRYHSWCIRKLLDENEGIYFVPETVNNIEITCNSGGGNGGKEK